MGSNPTQAVGVLLALLAFVGLGLAFSGGGILALLGAIVLLGISCALFMKAKPWENGGQESSGSMKSMAAREVKG